MIERILCDFPLNSKGSLTLLPKITCPVLLIWGKEDKITPPFVGEEFHKLIKSSELVWMEDCGHAPMMEQPKEFNILLANFLNKISVSV